MLPRVVRAASPDPGCIPRGGISTLGVVSTTTVTVTGMTCEHCAMSVREEIGEIGGVTAVDVDLTSGLVTIDSETPVEPAAIKTAVEEAGYRLAG